MSIENSKLLDADQGLFSVLGLVTLRLIGPFLWRFEDYNDNLYRGTIFRAYPSLVEPATQDVRDVAYIFVVDVTEDAAEPDISEVEEADVPAMDALIRESTHNEIIASGMQMVQWLSSHLNKTASLKGLVTAYSINENGNERQCVALRINVKGRKIIAQCVFDVEKKNELAAPIFNILRDITVVL